MTEYYQLAHNERHPQTRKPVTTFVEPLEAHVWICVLALLVARVAELACSQLWFRIQGALDALQATEFLAPTQIFFQLNEASQPLRQLFKSLAIPLPKRVLAITAHPKQPSGA